MFGLFIPTVIVAISILAVTPIAVALRTVPITTVLPITTVFSVTTVLSITIRGRAVIPVSTSLSAWTGMSGSSGSHWGGGSVSPPGVVLCPGVGGSVALLGGIGGFGCGWGSGGGAGWCGGGTGPGGNGIAPTSAWPGSIPNGIGSVSGLKGGVCLLMGLYRPVLGVALAKECCLLLGFAPPSAEFGLDHPSVESRLVHLTQLPFCFSSFSWASWAFLAWGLSWVLGSSSALPSWVSSRVAAIWIHLLPHQVLALGSSLSVPLGLKVCLDPPPAL